MFETFSPLGIQRGKETPFKTKTRNVIAKWMKGEEKGKPTYPVWKKVRIFGKENTTFSQSFKEMVE